MAKSFTEIPVSTPETPTLDLVNEPKDLRDLNESQLETLADELREFLLFSVGQTGGHFGAGLGVVELTIALHYIFNTPDDSILSKFESALSDNGKKVNNIWKIHWMQRSTGNSDLSLWD